MNLPIDPKEASERAKTIVQLAAPAPAAKRRFYETRLILVESTAFIPHAGHAERREVVHYYLAAMFVDDLLTIVRPVQADEVLILRDRIARHNSAIAGQLPGDEELGLSQIEAERKRATARRGGPSELFKA